MSRQEQEQEQQIDDPYNQETDLKCSTCYKEFKLKRTLQAHIMIHTGEKPFKCSKCEQSFRQYSSLQKHDRIHTGDRPYICQECNANFSQISNLKRHEKKHTFDKPYNCESCGKSFITQQNYNQHKSKHESVRKMYVCTECAKSYLYKCSLKKHTNDSHPKNQVDPNKKISKEFQEEQEQQKQQEQQEQQEQVPSIENFFTFDHINLQFKNLREFFTCTHPQIFHQNHIDILFNGRLYNYNEENGRIEYHELEDQGKVEECDPIKEHQHFIKKTYAQLDCSSCVDKNGQKLTEDCCKNCKDNCNDCCLACNKGLCGEGSFPQSQILHFHGPNCGHPIVIHNGHVDYLVNEILHYPHDGHCDFHGVLSRITVQ